MKLSYEEIDCDPSNNGNEKLTNDGVEYVTKVKWSQNTNTNVTEKETENHPCNHKLIVPHVIGNTATVTTNPETSESHNGTQHDESIAAGSNKTPYNAPIGTKETIKSPSSASDIRQMWKTMGASGDNDALIKLEAIREADRMARRKSRQQLKARAQSGDPVALAIRARNRITNTNAHRKRNANLRAKAASGDEEAISKLETMKAKDKVAHQKCNQRKREYNARCKSTTSDIDFKYSNTTMVVPSVSIVEPKPGDNTIYFQCPNKQLVDGEEEAISALGLLHRSYVPDKLLER